MTDSERDVRENAMTGDQQAADAWSDSPADLSRPGVDDLAPAAAERIHLFMAESTVRGGASPSDVANLYTSQEIMDDDEATAYLDRRFVHGEVLADWRAFQDRLSTAYLDSRPGTTAEALLADVHQRAHQLHEGRSIFDDPDEDELPEEERSERIDGRDPHMFDLTDESRWEIERYIVSDVLCYGVAPYKVMQLRERLRTDGDERALQYLDLPFELGDRPADWDRLRDRALMVRARLESRGVDPADAYAQLDQNHPTAGAAELLELLDQHDHRR